MAPILCAALLALVPTMAPASDRLADEQTVVTLLHMAEGTHPADRKSSTTVKIDDCQLVMHHETSDPGGLNVIHRVGLSSLQLSGVTPVSEPDHTRASVLLAKGTLTETTFFSREPTEIQKTFFRQSLDTICEPDSCRATKPLMPALDLSVWGDKAASGMTRTLAALDRLATACKGES